MLTTQLWKPHNWNRLKLCTKIKLYKNVLDERYAKYVDKIDSKKIAHEMNENIKIPEIIKIIETPNDFTEEDINDDYILKASHGSGWNIDLQKIKDITTIRKYIDKLLESQFLVHGEMQYKYVKPRFLIERKIENVLLDYKIYCFHGTPTILQIVKNIKPINESDDGRRRNFYDTKNFNLIKKPDFYYSISEEEKEMIKKMCEVSKTLSKDFEFVRIDLYNSNNEIYFGEFTFTPLAGKQMFDDKKELQIGKLWH